MKKLFLGILLSCFLLLAGYSQIVPPSSDSLAVVYFARITTDAPWIKFSIFDSTSFIGRIETRSYLRYECACGPHLFWANSERNDFIHAELEGGRIYLIQALAESGVNKARVSLNSVKPDNDFMVAKIVEMIEFKPPVTYTPKEFAKQCKKQNKKVETAFVRYEEDIRKGRLYGNLKKEWYYEEE